MKLAVHSITGKETSKKVDLSTDVFGVEPNDHAIYLDVLIKQKNDQTLRVVEES